MNSFKFDYQKTGDKEVLVQLHNAIKIAQEHGFEILIQSKTNTLLAVKNQRGYFLTNKTIIEK